MFKNSTFIVKYFEKFNTQRKNNRKADPALGGKYESVHLQVRDPTAVDRSANGRSAGKARTIYDLQPVGRHQVTTSSKFT